MDMFSEMVVILQRRTPKHLLRHVEPSLFFSGQTTSCVAVVSESVRVVEEDAVFDFGGMAWRHNRGS